MISENLFRTFVFIKYFLPLPHYQQWEIQEVCLIADNIGERCKSISKIQNMALENLFRTFVSNIFIAFCQQPLNTLQLSSQHRLRVLRKGAFCSTRLCAEMALAHPLRGQDRAMCGILSRHSAL